MSENNQCPTPEPVAVVLLAAPPENECGENAPPSENCQPTIPTTTPPTIPATLPENVCPENPAPGECDLPTSTVPATTIPSTECGENPAPGCENPTPVVIVGALSAPVDTVAVVAVENQPTALPMTGSDGTGSMLAVIALVAGVTLTSVARRWHK